MTDFILKTHLKIFGVVLTAIATTITIYYSLLQETWGVIVLLVAVNITIYLIFFYYLNKNHKVYLATTENLANTFHLAAHHLRDELYELDHLRNEDRITVPILRYKLTAIAQRTVELLAEALQSMTGKEIHICVKYFETRTSGQFTPENLKNTYISVLCRSGNTFDQDRPPMKRLNVYENTEFYYIMHQNMNYFAASDLEKQSVILKQSIGREYQNTDINWREYYKSRIVVPIRLSNKCKRIEEDGYDWVGFLCADSEELAFNEKEMDQYIDIVKAYADGLYVFFDRIITLKEEIENNEQKGEN